MPERAVNPFLIASLEEDDEPEPSVVTPSEVVPGSLALNEAAPPVADAEPKAVPPSAEPPIEVEQGESSVVVAGTVQGFCARCRTKRPVSNPTHVRTKMGKRAVRGTCAVCGAGMFVFSGE